MKTYVVEQTLVTTRELMVFASSPKQAEKQAKEGRYDEMLKRPGKLKLLTTTAFDTEA